MIKKALKLFLLIGGIVYVVAITVKNTYASSSRVETVNYQSQYRGRSYRKQALVYLPPNYSARHRYNVIYLVHGSTETPRDFFRDGKFQQSLDQLITAGKLKPSIVVFPTYYPNRSFVTSDYYRDNRLNRAFAQNELVQDLVPAVEGRYHTYANGTSTQALQASRNHRAFGGFSMGAITSWYVFQYQLPYFQTFIPVAGDSWTVQDDGGSSAPTQTARRLAQTAQEHSQLDFRILAGVGRNDGTSGSMGPQIQAMHRLPEFNNRNLQYYQVPGGNHSPRTTRRAFSHYADQLFN